MIAAETGVDAVDLFEAVDDARLGQPLRRQVAADIGEAGSDARDRNADGDEAGDSFG